jgi:hypothetical protein
MIIKITRITLLVALSLGSLSCTAKGQAAGSKPKAGKKREVVLKESAKIGDTTLEPATYVVQHQVIDERHYVRFQKLVEYRGAHLLPAFKPVDAGLFQCKLEPVLSKFKTTELFIDQMGKDKYITKLEIKGEDAADIF